MQERSDETSLGRRGRQERSQLRRLGPEELDRPDGPALAALERFPLHVLVENVRSAHNVGSILRTADALRVRHVHLVGFTPPADHRLVHKTALGAQDTVPWSHHATLQEAIDGIRRDGCVLVALEQTDRPTPVATLTASDFPCCLVVGNEVEGVSDEALAACDLAIEVEQFGMKHSLNVAVAFGVAAYDLVRRWKALDADARGLETA